MKNDATPRPGVPPSERELITLLDKNIGYVFSDRELAGHFSVAGRQDLYELADLLEQLIDDDKILFIDKQGGGFTSLKSAREAEGVVDYASNRRAFVVVDAEAKDVSVSTDDLATALHGDRVRVRYMPAFAEDAKPEGKVIEVLERARTRFVGTVRFSGRRPFLHPEMKRIWDEIFIKDDELLGAKDGDKAVVEILEWGLHKTNLVGRVVEVLGRAGTHQAEMLGILSEFGLPEAFPEEVEAEAAKIKAGITKAEVAKRRDMRAIPTFTIDPIDAKDFDDALSLRQLEDGLYEVGVHIADVTHYVRPGTALEDEAQRRATSVYLVDRVVPMLPEHLSNNLCSLRPHEDKLTFSAIFTLDLNGQIKDKWYGRTVIHSDHRFAYEDVQELLENTQYDVHQGLPGSAPAPKPKTTRSRKKVDLTLDAAAPMDAEVVSEVMVTKAAAADATAYVPHVHILNHIAYALRRERFAHGAVSFETPELKFVLDTAGKPIKVVAKVRKDAHKLIEDFMLLANKYVAEFAYGLDHPLLSKKAIKDAPLPTTPGAKHPMVYRVHEAPDDKKIQDLATFANRFGHKLEFGTGNLPKALNQLSERVEGLPEGPVIAQYAIRSMQKARYTLDPLGHFGLGYRHYSHFTSPIRRYPDMMAHRLLGHYLAEEGPGDLFATLERQCKHSTDMEKRAADAERASVKYKQVEFMMDRIGEEFDGIVSGLTEWGLYVEIVDTACEGMVRLADISDDHYLYDPTTLTITGRRTGRRFQFGDRLRIRIKDANLLKRTLDLEMADQGPRRPREDRNSGNYRSDRDSKGGGKRGDSRSGSRSESKSSGKSSGRRGR